MRPINGGPLQLSLNDNYARRATSAHSRDPRKYSRWAVAALAVGTVLAGPAPAYAEGTWTSHLDRVSNQHISRHWTDNNNDGVVTKVSVKGCSRSDDATFSLEVDLRRDRSLQPDVSYGRKKINACKTATGVAAWSDQTAGSYFLQFYSHTFGTVSATSVVTVY
jgi:hypothetical protein